MKKASAPAAAAAAMEACWLSKMLRQDTLLLHVMVLLDMHSSVSF
jgi:hypothetical protein